MKAVLLHGPDPSNPVANLEVVTDAAKPKAGPGEVLIHITMRPVDPADVLCMQGVYAGFAPAKYPAVPGLEGAGRIEEVGAGVSGFKEGQRVTPWLLNDYLEPGNGSWQEYIAVKASDVIAVPDSVSDETASQFTVNPLTVVGMLKVLNVPKGEYILQTAAGSVLGRQLIAVAKHWGIKTINVVRRSAQIEELKAIGADEVISSSDEDVVSRVKAITGGKGAYAGVDCVSGELSGAVVASVRGEGTVLLYGAMSGLGFQASVADLLFRDVVLRGYWVTTCVQKMSPDEKRAFFDETMALVEAQVISPFHGEKYKLENVVEAVKKHMEEARGGKVFLI